MTSARMKLIDDPQWTQGSGPSGMAIPAKARLINRITELAPTNPRDTSGKEDPKRANKINDAQRTSIPRPRRDPSRQDSGITKNKSSLLTFQKGRLRSVKGRYHRGNSPIESYEAVESAAGPSASRDKETPALNTSLTDEDAIGETDSEAARGDSGGNVSGLPVQPLAVSVINPDYLPNFEEANDQMNDVVIPQETQPEHSTATTSVQQSLTPGNNQSQSPPSAIPGMTSTSWTIFGPMYDASSATVESSSASSSLPAAFDFYVGSTTVPVILNDSSAENRISASTMAAQAKASGSGSDFGTELVPDLLSTLRYEGSIACVLPDHSADDYQKSQFENFCRRVDSGIVRLKSAGKSSFMFFSSSNRFVAERLGIPSALIGLANTVLLALVTLEDPAGYANLLQRIG